MKKSTTKPVKHSFELRCSSCGLLDVWGMEQAVGALTASGDLSPAADFDALLFAELFLARGGKLPCPRCRQRGTLRVGRVESGDWDWEDAVYCKNCGREIPPTRLAAVPGARLCVSCQTEEDFANGF